MVCKNIWNKCLGSVIPLTNCLVCLSISYVPYSTAKNVSIKSVLMLKTQSVLEGSFPLVILAIFTVTQIRDHSKDSSFQPTVETMIG